MHGFTNWSYEPPRNDFATNTFGANPSWRHGVQKKYAESICVPCQGHSNATCSCTHSATNGIAANLLCRWAAYHIAITRATIGKNVVDIDACPCANEGVPTCKCCVTFKVVPFHVSPSDRTGVIIAWDGIGASCAKNARAGVLVSWHGLVARRRNPTVLASLARFLTVEL